MKKLFTLLIFMMMAAWVIPLHAATETYTFNSKSWGATNSSGATADWTSGKGSLYDSSNGVQVTSANTGANATSPESFSNISAIDVVWGTTSKGAGSFAVQVGSGTAQSFTVSKGKSNQTKSFSFSPNETGKVKITVTCSTNSIYIKSIKITYATTAPEAPKITCSEVTDGVTTTEPTLNLSASGAYKYYYTIGEDTTPDDPTESSASTTGEIDSSNFTAGHTYIVKAIAVNSAGTSSVTTFKFTYKVDTTVTIWSEDWTGQSNGATPASVTSAGGTGTATYSYTDGGSATKLYTSDISAGGTSPELLVGKNNGAFTATITLPTGVQSPLTLSYMRNNNTMTVTTTTSGVTVGSASGSNPYSHEITIPSGLTQLVLVFTATTSKNVRLDNIMLKGKVGEVTKCADVTFDPSSAASFIGRQSVTLTSTEGSTIAYTVYKDGVATSQTDSVTSGSAITITDTTGSGIYTIKATASKSGLKNSDEATSGNYYANKPATPTVSPTTVTLNSATAYTFTTATEGATLYYTTDGREPSASLYNGKGTEGASSVTVNVTKTMTVKVIAIKNGVASDVLEKTYTFTVGAPTFSPAAGEFYNGSVDVTIASATTGAVIYYTTDGTEPSATNGTQYDGSFTLTRTTTVKAIAIYNGQSSAVSTAVYTRVKASGAVTLWSEDWTGATSLPSSVTSGGTGTATYEYSNVTLQSGASNIYAGGSSPEILIKSGGGKFTATITFASAVSGDLTLSFLENHDYVTVTSSTTGVTVGALSYDSSTQLAQCTVTVPAGTTELVLVFTNSKSSNDRVDNFNLVQVVGGVSDVKITPAAGTYNNVQTVTIDTDDDDDVTVYYTTDGTKPSATKYTGKFVGGEKATVTVSQTGTVIRAKGIDSEAYEGAESTETYTLVTAPVNPGSQSAVEFLNDFSLVLRTATEDATIYYTTDGSEPGAGNGTAVASGTSITIDRTMTLRAVAVKDGFTTGAELQTAFTKVPIGTPYFSRADGTYTDAQTVYIMDDSNDAVIYYTITYDGSEPADPSKSSGTLYELNSVIALPIGTTRIKAIAYNSDDVASTIVAGEWTCEQGNLALSLTPGSGAYIATTTVKVRVDHAVGDATIYYTTDGSEPGLGVGTLYDAEAGIEVATDMTVRVWAQDERAEAEGKTATNRATYKIGVQIPEFSPFSGTTIEYKGTNHSIQIFSTTDNAKIYYTITTDGSEPADPTTSSTLYTGENAELNGLAIGTYKVKAIAVVGSERSAIASGVFNIVAHVSGLENVAALHAATATTTTTYFENPLQIIWMDRYLNGGDDDPTNDTIQYAYVRDNSGYGQIYFGNPRYGYGAGKTHFEMGDWIDGSQVGGPISVWSDGFGNQLGTSGMAIPAWPTTSIGHTDILPELTTLSEINAGDTNGENLWAHYVHVRNLKPAIRQMPSERYQGTVTDVNGVMGTYYDSFYLHRDKGQDYWDAQPANRTFDVVGVVAYYKQLESGGYPSNFELSPIEFEYTDQATMTPAGGDYQQAQTVKIDFDDDVPAADREGVTIYYKTSDMEDYELYTGPFVVRSTTTVQAYTEKPSKFGGTLKSVINEQTYTFASVETPVITPKSRTFKYDEAPLEVTIECGTAAVTIWYTTDGSDPLTPSGTRQKYTGPISISENTTVRALATLGTVTSPEAQPQTYTLVKNNGIEYELVEDVTELQDGYTYVIVNQENEIAMSNVQKDTGNRGGVAITLSADKKKATVNDDVARFTISSSGSVWHFYTDDGDADSQGYLSAGTGTSNQLLTKATTSTLTEATIAIDATDKTAEIHFVDGQGVERYMAYWSYGTLFNLYKKENYSKNIHLYMRKSTELADIVNNGTVNNVYTVADDIVVAVIPQFAGENVAFAKDLGKSQIANVNTKGAIDYMGDILGLTAADKLDQSTWVKLTGNVSSLNEGDVISGGSLTGKLVNKVNPEFQVTSAPVVNGSSAYSPQTYSVANLMGEYQTGENDGKEYFFVEPKPYEYMTLLEVYYGGNDEFYIPSVGWTANGGTMNSAGLKGGFSADWSMISAEGTRPSSLSEGTVVKITGLVKSTDSKASARRKASSYDSSSKTSAKVVMPTSILTSTVPTDVEGVEATRTPVRVLYYNMSGMMNDRPFEGVPNVVVITYDDGTTETHKSMF